MNPISTSTASQISGPITRPTVLCEIAAGNGQPAVYLHSSGRETIEHDGEIWMPGLIGHTIEDRAGAAAIATVMIDNRNLAFSANLDDDRALDRNIRITLFYGPRPWSAESAEYVFSGEIVSLPEIDPRIMINASTEQRVGRKNGIPLSLFSDQLPAPGVYAFFGEYYNLESN